MLDEDSIIHKLWSRWYDKAKARAEQDPEYADLRANTSWLDSHERQSEIMYQLTPQPLWLKLLTKAGHNKKLKPRWWKGEITHRWQRSRQGYSYQDLWNFDWYLGHLCEKAFIEMRDQAHGWPGDPMTFEEWLDIHTKIAEAFKAKREQHNIDFKDREQHDCDHAILEAKWVEGMELFTKWYGGFWN